MNYRKRLSRILTALFAATLALSVGPPARPAAASGNYNWDFEPPSQCCDWTAGGDPSVTGQVLEVKSTDNHCPENGAFYDDLSFDSSPDPSAAVWMQYSFPGDGGYDSVVLDWAIKDKGAGCSLPDPCDVGYYVGITPPTSRAQFVHQDFIDDALNPQWHDYNALLGTVNQGTIYVAFSWRHIRGNSNGSPGAMGFDCVNVNISTVSSP